MNIFQNLKPHSKQLVFDGKTVEVREVPFPIYKQIVMARNSNNVDVAFTLMLLHGVYHDGERVFKSESDLADLPAGVADQLIIAATEVMTESRGNDNDLKKN